MQILRFCQNLRRRKTKLARLRRGSNMVLLNPPPISQNRDWHKAAEHQRLAKTA